jgi:hypothetical protein
MLYQIADDCEWPELPRIVNWYERIGAKAKHRASIGFLTIGVSMLVALGFGGCSGSASSNVAVEVGSRSITTATVAHWMSIIAGEGSLPSGQPFPLTPDPPRYSTCIAYNRKFPSTSANESPQSGQAALKRACEVEYQKERLKALYFLISYEWVSGEASELGVYLPSKAAQEELSLLKARLPGPALRKFLVGSRGTFSDMLMRIKLELLTRIVQEHLEKGYAERHLTPQQRQQALEDFGKRFRTQWSAETACHVGYVVPICKGYVAPRIPPPVSPPGIPLTTMRAGSSGGLLEPRG